MNQSIEELVQSGISSFNKAYKFLNVFISLI